MLHKSRGQFVSDEGTELANPGKFLHVPAGFEESGNLGDGQPGKGSAVALGAVGVVTLEVKEQEPLGVEPPDLGDVQGRRRSVGGGRNGS